jgi:effector-binding domain-containing protein
VVAAGPAVTRYEDVPGSGAVVVHAGLPVAADVDRAGAANLVVLAGVARAATIVHCGSPDDVLPTVQALARWLDANGHRMTAQHARELALACPPDHAEWVTELQVPIDVAR